MTHSMLSHYSYPTPHGPITICTSERGVRAVGAACWHPAPDGAFEPLRHRASGILCWEAHRLRRPARPRGDRVPEKRVGSAFPRALRHLGHQRRYRAQSGETEVIPRCWGRGERKPTRRNRPRPSGRARQRTAHRRRRARAHPRGAFAYGAGTRGSLTQRRSS